MTSSIKNSNQFNSGRPEFRLTFLLTCLSKFIFCCVMTISDYIVANLSSEVKNKFAKILGLACISETERGGNVCSVNSGEVRNDFRISFTTNDLLNYFFALTHSTAFRQKFENLDQAVFSELPFPSDSEQFWQLAELGRQLRNSIRNEQDNLTGIDELVQRIDTVCNH